MPRDPSITSTRSELLAELRKVNERWFETQWKRIDGPEYQSEFLFHSERQYRADFCWPEVMTILEVDGGGHRLFWNKYHQDIEKQNDAHFEGWRIFRLTRKMIQDEDVQFLYRLKDYLLKEMEQE